MDTEFLESLDVPSVIAKDECIYCYETPFNEAGDIQHALNICLFCFQAVCKRHSSLHMDVCESCTGTFHCYYLNISKIKKPIANDDEDQEQNNKKIKLQVKDKSEDELYETDWHIKQFTSSETKDSTVHFGSKTSEDVPSKALENINRILKAKSKDLVDQSSTWELELGSCPHVQMIEKAGDTIEKTNSISLKQCTSCDLKENLWLCLHCGNTGCGREQIGIEGHSHALAHVKEKPAHSLAVKLGSLSSDSSDVYCYTCDNEVRFDDMAKFRQILEQHGIDLNKKTADEKTLIEMQIEQNMNWDFKMVDAQGNTLTRLHPDENLGSGLINLGNSCYMNSVLQCLFNGGVPGWSLDQLGTEFPKDVVYPSTNLLCQLIKLRNGMKQDVKLYPNGIKPRSFKNCIGNLHKEFSTAGQQDAMEFFTFLIDELDKKIFNKSSDSNPNDIIKFLIEERLQCTKCKKVRYTVQPSEAIQLPLLDNTKSQDLEERLHDYFSGEQLEYRCSTCKEPTTAIKQPALKTFPDTLVINPIRIKVENWMPVKTSNELNMPGLEASSIENCLDLSQYRSKGFDETVETLLSDDEDDSFQPNSMFLQQLMEMGFMENAAKRALYTTGNQDLEAAMNWLFQHVDDADLDDPFSVPKSNALNSQIDQSSLDSMVAMGLDPKLCRKALVLQKGDVNASVEWVFNNMDDDGIIAKASENGMSGNDNKNHGHLDPSPYHLTAIVCHKGTSVQSGHYVVFIKKYVEQKLQWILYNDEKIVIADDNLEEIKKNGYIYLFSRNPQY